MQNKKINMEELLKTVNMEFIKKDKKLDFLKPSRNLVETVTKPQSFTKTKRPELFPVKHEHKRPPCSYLNKNFTTLCKKTVSTNQQARDC